MAQRKKGEVYMELATRLTDRKWTTTCTNMEELADKMMMEQLLNNKPTDLCIWLGERKPSSCRVLADDYVMARHRGRLDFLKNTEEKKPDGLSNQEERKCYSCQQPGHFARDCPKKTQDPRHHSHQKSLGSIDRTESVTTVTSGDTSQFSVPAHSTVVQ